MTSVRTVIQLAMAIFALVVCGALPAQVTIDTPGNKFTIAGLKGTAHDVGEGRIFQGAQYQQMTIKAPVSLPVRPNPTKSNLGRIAIHFRSSPTSASLRSVQLCSRSNCQNPLNTNIRGDYSTREAIYSTNSTSANVWVFTPPRLVSTGFSVVLTISFPGLIDYGTMPAKDLEFTLMSVDAYFPDAVQTHMGMPKVSPKGVSDRMLASGVIAAYPTANQSLACGGNESTSAALVGGLAAGMKEVAIDNLILMYHPVSGAAVVFKRDEEGKLHCLKSYAARAFTPGWTHIVSTPNGILFYNSVDGSAVIGRLDEDGVLTNLKSYGPGSFAIGWTSIRYTSDGIEYRNDKTGASAHGEIDADGTHITK